MKLIKIKYLLIIFIILIIFNCSKKLPEDKHDFLGEWKGENILLTISKNGNISYTKFNKGFSMNTSGPVKYIGNDKIVYSVFFKKITIKIQKPPFKSGDQWKMVVENKELTRIGDGGWNILKKFKKNN